MTKRKGFFLIFSLWLFFLLSLFCIGLGFRTFVETRKTKLFLNRSRAFYLAVSGVKMAQGVLGDDELDEVVHLQQAWATGISKQAIAFSSPRKQGRLAVVIEDESSRLDINELALSISPENFDSAVLVKFFENQERDQ